ncbi:GPH family glycoside/pentoside/hexuronide:cation symporter [Bacillus pakistanensis]|uniref:GPH family glycoside/pentoside/hexuronide:cation symporter n=1 Tax=Rossellomorea pakistanensis TaxID=992288 RepID=A0ABS2NHM3_9BACI|nr:GPH family glycoside/pentoside/hexuronide:cation symporter [Bacillus pakistanensis]
MAILKADTSVELQSDKLGTKEKVSYGLGDLASNFVWGMTSAYLLFFYTDIFGISAAAVGTLFLITRIWDAINDPMMGVIVDKTKSRHGKTRPYLLYLSIPFGILSVLTFITPDFSDTGKLVYAYITYFLLGMIYTAINLPYGALMSTMTRDSNEKSQLGSFRMMGLAVGTIIVSALTMPLVEFFGNGNLQVGFPITMAVYSIVGVILFFITFKNCKERYSDHLGAGSNVKVGKSFSNMLKNQPWVVISINSIVQFLRIGVLFGVLIYYVTYVLEQPALVPLYLTLASVANFAGGAIAPWALKRLGNRNGSIILLSASVPLFVLLIFLEDGSTILFATVFFIALTLIGINGAANFAMLADTIDYQEWKFGQRTEGLLYSGYSFATKFGIAIGSALVAYALGWAGYNPDAITESALSMIRFLLFAGLIAFTILQVITLAFYKLDQNHAEIIKELEMRNHS